jgi:hypothetical protein
MRNYNAAFRYWALRPSGVTASAFAPVTELRAGLAQLTQDYANALAAFRPPPQLLRELAVDIDDAAVLAALRTKGEVVVAMPLAAKAFAGLGRVRLTRVRAWLQGVAAGAPVIVEISTSGKYDDRLSGASYRFTSAPVLRTFQYQGAFGDDKGIIVDGMVADEEQFAYFQPTPFTEWLIRVPADRNPGLRLDSITALRLSFAGSVIGQQPDKAAVPPNVQMTIEAVK